MPSPLVDAAWLAAHLDDPTVRIADVRWYLAGKRGADAYAAGHIPGAAFVDLDRDLAVCDGGSFCDGGAETPPNPPDPSSRDGAGTPGSFPGRHPLPSAAGFAALLARLGVTRDTVIVAYDDAGGAIAARLWWLLRWFGHGGGRVLDGGIGAWLAAGHPLTTDIPNITPAPLLDPPAAPAARVAGKAEVDRLRAHPRALLLDARASERFEGRVEPVDARPGHIPGARSAPFAGNLTAPGGTFRSPAELAERYRALGAFEAETVVCYCGSGVTACHDVLALAIAGRDDATLYAGSWSEWAADPSLPAALGE